MSQYAPDTELHWAAHSGSVEEVRDLLARGYDVNSQHKDHPYTEGSTPLHVAVREGYPLVVAVLLEHGADGTLADYVGATPLHHAARLDRVAEAELLLVAGVDPNVRCHYEATPLHYAAKAGNLAVAELLLEHGADVNAVDDWARTPLDIAATYTEGLVALLEAHGAEHGREVRQQGEYRIERRNCPYSQASVKVRFEEALDFTQACPQCGGGITWRRWGWYRAGDPDIPDGVMMEPPAI